ncbi:hypothetical protein QJS10_CPA07g00442 [Acorus calamus]|uniref:Uncharacterized protein n=1 Tax=Acorus calamus TaxID=4465 RepID=A0AAV9EHZ4_ACOCL|nr:hypothetical protein QJS10_CPA07g00442 [Acorus calamus]
MEKEVSLLSRLAANHLFLGQFEPLRAALLSLRRRDPFLSLSILRSIVSFGGRIDGVRCPALLAWLCVLEFLDHGGGGPEGANPEALRAKAEFLLLVHLVCEGVSESAPDGEVSISDVDSVALLDRISDLGLRRLKAEMGDGGDEGHVADSVFEEEELRSLWKVCLDQPEIFDELSWNIQKQVGDSGPSDAGSTVEETEGLKRIQEGVQMAHLDALRECLAEDDLDGAIAHLRFLHWDFGLESEYRYCHCFHCFNL